MKVLLAALDNSDLVLFAFIALGIVALIPELKAALICSRRGHVSEREFHPLSKLRERRCVRCRRWLDAP